jgi:hypothetical protein
MLLVFIKYCENALFKNFNHGKIFVNKSFQELAREAQAQKKCPYKTCESDRCVDYWQPCGDLGKVTLADFRL